MFTLENITLFLSIFGSLGTVWNIVKSRRKLMFDVKQMGIVNGDLVIFSQVINQSNLSISIYDVSLRLGNQYIFCEKDLRSVGSFRHTVGNVLMRDHHQYTPEFPIVIGGFGGSISNLLFELPQGTSIDLSKPLILRVSTSRGPITVSLCKPVAKQNSR